MTDLVRAVSFGDVGDDALLARARGGDGDAFGQLVEPRIERTLRTARAILGSEADAREVTQEAFVSAWINLRGLRDTTRFDAWLNRIVLNRCRDRLRQRRRIREVAMDTVELPAGDLADASAETGVVLAAFERLGVADRQILVLRHLHDQSLDEIARQLDVPVGTVKSRLWRARRALERALEAET
jgi:RNA polymerase sigma-70 factor (ECF subfamily)